MDGVKFVNLTPHDVVIVMDNGDKLIIPASGQIARVRVQQVEVGEVDGIPIFKSEFGDVEGLPEPQDGVVFIVSTLVLQALKNKGIQRDDVIAPNTNTAIRDKDGRIIGVKGFQVL